MAAGSLSTLANLTIRVGTSTKDAVKGLTNLDARVKATKRKFTRLEDSTLSLGKAMGVMAGAAGLAFAAKKTFDLGAAVEETASKFRTVFGPATEDVQAFIDDFGVMAGLSNTAAREVVATTGAIVQGMGFAQQASADYAEQVVRLAGDLSSFNNIPIAETSRAIQAAITGEREQLKRLGIVVREADVQQRALVQSGKDSASALTQQEKAAATLSLIMERAGVAVGDLERTQDSAANVSRRVAARFQNIKEAIASALLPAMSVFLEHLDSSVGGLEGLREELEGQVPVIQAWARFAIEAGKFVAKAFAAPIRIAFELGQAIGELFNIIFVARNFGDVGEAVGRMGDRFGDMWDVVTDLTGSFQEMRTAAGNAFQTPPGAPEFVETVHNATTATNDLSAAQRELIATLNNDLNPAILDNTSSLAGVTGRMSMLRSELIEIPEGTKIATDGVRELAGWQNQLASTVAQSTTQISTDFGRMAQSIIADISRTIAKLLVMRGLMAIFAPFSGGAGIGGALFSAFSAPFGGERAMGGPVQAGRSFLVGEQGPELFVPQSSGQIVPNEQVGAGNVTMNVRVPPQRTPFDGSRDRDWLRSLQDSLEELGANGFSLQVVDA